MLSTFHVPSGPNGDVLLSTDDYSIGDHNLTITATDFCGRMKTEVLTFTTHRRLQADWCI